MTCELCGGTDRVCKIGYCGPAICRLCRKLTDARWWDLAGRIG